MSSEVWKDDCDNHPHAVSAMLADAPLISVVTPSFNQARFIGEALTSVQFQRYHNYEHIVIDGMSSDCTVEILRDRFSAIKQSNVFWISESDSGQSEALNKGFRLAKGEIVGWLNSDDRYQPDCFERVAKAFREHPEVDIVYGDYFLINETGEVLKIRREIEFNAFILLYHRVLYIPTTATFFRRRVFDENNWLDEQLHYAMDLKFFINLSERGYRFMHIPEVLADFRLQPASKTSTSSDKQRAEHRATVITMSPLLCNLPSPRWKTSVLSFLRLLAGIRRYTEKLLRGYYWERLRSSKKTVYICNVLTERAKPAINREGLGK